MTANKLSLRITVAFLSVSLFFASCNSDDTTSDDEPTSLEITVTGVIDVSDIEVSIYTNETDWLNETNQAATGITDDEGQVVFSDLIPDQAYYIDAVKDSATNWDTLVETQVILENMRNEFVLPLTASLSNYLVGKKEKSWQLVELTFQGSSIFEVLEDCEKDNIYIFQREDQSGLQDFGPLQCEGETTNQSFDWALNNSETELTLELENGNQETFNIPLLSSDSLVIESVSEADGVTVRIRSTYLHVP